jgi:arylsulfatase A-like enzyme
MRPSLLSVVCALVLWLPGAAFAALPNIVVVVVDTLRPDRLGAYGNTRGLTPFLDQLARRGTVFANAYANSSWTEPSVASLLTSRYVSQHGVVSFDSKLPTSEVTLADRLTAGGYVAGGFSANFRLSDDYGYGQGFEHWAVFLPVDGEAKPRGSVLRRESAAWLSKMSIERMNSPVMLYLQYMEPHAPYVPPEPYRTKFAPPSGADADEHTANTKLIQLTPGDKHLTGPEVALLKSLYDGEVAAVDAEISALFAQLEQLGLLKDAVVVVTADHGEEFGEHGEFLHGSTLYNPSIRVPLIIAGPGIDSDHTVTENVSLLDLAPTLLDLAHLPAAPTFEGRSFVSLMRSPSPGSQPWSGEVISELERDVPTGFDRRIHARAIVDGSQKLLVAPSGKTALYDVSSDPGETKPLDGAAAAARTTDLLARLEHRQSTWRARATTSSTVQPLDEGTKEKLRALGYQP